MLRNKSYNRSAISFVVLAFIFLLSSCGGSADLEYVDRAKEYLKNQELNAASLELKNALLSNNKNAEARYLLGKVKLEIGDARTAEKELRRAIEAGWNEAEATILLAEALLRQGKFKALLEEIKAKDKYQKVALAEIMGLRAAAYIRLEQWDDAAEAVAAGEALQQKVQWLLLSKARLAIHDNDFTLVKETLVAALILYPDSKDLWLLSAGVSADEKDFDGAASALQKVIELEPPKIMTAWGRQARLGQFRIFFRQNQIANASVALNPVLKTYSTDPEANYFGALLAFAEANHDLAEERLLMVLRVIPSHHEALLLFGRLNYAQKDFQQAAYYLEKATSSSPDDMPAQSLLGKTYLQLGQYDEAEKKLRFAITHSNDNAELLALVGEVKIRSGDARAGIDELEKAALLDPADKNVSRKLANVYLASGDTASAIQTLEASLASGNQNQQFQSMLLLSYVRVADFDKAHKLADEIIEQSSEQSLAYNLKAVTFEAQKNFVAASEHYNKALSNDPDNSLAQLSLARLDRVQGNAAQAEKRYRKLLKVQPENSAALVALAKLLAGEGQAEEAIELLNKARQVNPAELQARLILSNYFLIRNDVQQSLLIAKEALHVAPQSPSAMLAVARVQLLTDKPAALRVLENLVEYSPEFAEAYFYLAQAQSLSNDKKGVQQSLQQAVKLKPDYLPAQLALLRLDLQAGKIDKVLVGVRQILQRHKQSSAAYVLKGDALVAKKDIPAAVSAYQQASEYSNKSDAVLRISKLYQLQGKADMAIKELVVWLDKHGDNFSVRFVLASSYLAMGQNEKSYTEYVYLNKKYPANAAVLNDLAWLKFKKGEADALQVAEQAYKLAPENAAIQDTYGWILLKNGRVEAALLALQQASSNWPESLDVRYHYLAALAQAGEKQQAKKGLDVILNSGKAFAERDSAQALRDSL